MSDGIQMKSLCCPDKYMQHLEYDYLKVKYKSPIGKDWYDSRIPVYTCECKRRWAVERVVSSKSQTQADKKSVS